MQAGFGCAEMSEPQSGRTNLETRMPQSETWLTCSLQAAQTGWAVRLRVVGSLPVGACLNSLLFLWKQKSRVEQQVSDDVCRVFLNCLSTNGWKRICRWSSSSAGGPPAWAPAHVPAWKGRAFEQRRNDIWVREITRFAPVFLLRLFCRVEVTRSRKRQPSADFLHRSNKLRSFSDAIFDCKPALECLNFKERINYWILQGNKHLVRIYGQNST